MDLLSKLPRIFSIRPGWMILTLDLYSIQRVIVDLEKSHGVARKYVLIREQLPEYK